MYNIAIDINDRGDSLDVDFKYYYEAQVYTLPNGDPGHPEYSELEIINIYKNNKDYKPILNRFDKIYPKIDIFGLIEEYVLENMDDESDDGYEYEYEPDCEPDYPEFYDGT